METNAVELTTTAVDEKKKKEDCHKAMVLAGLKEEKKDGKRKDE